MKQMQAFSLASAGASRNANRDGSANVLHNRQTTFHIFHKIMSRRNALQIRSKAPEFKLLSQESVKKLTESDKANKQIYNKLMIKKSIPPGLDLQKLKELIKDYELVWGNTKETNYQYADSLNGMAELDLSPKALRQLVASQFHKEQSLTVQMEEKRIDGYLQQWLLSQEDIIAKSGSNHYQIPGQDELLFFDEEIISPLLKVIEQYKLVNQWTKPLLEKLNIIMGYSAAFNYTLIQYQHQQSGEKFFILKEIQASEHKRYWGTYVFRLGKANPFMIEIPRPLYEVNSFEYAVSLFEQLKAQYLLIAGAHPYSNVDGSADLVRLDNQASLFTLVNQIVGRSRYRVRKKSSGIIS
jgi:gamma-polyglutamate biosynthesis protein CapC